MHLERLIRRSIMILALVSGTVVLATGNQPGRAERLESAEGFFIPTPSHPANPPLFGVINDEGNHYNDLWNRGVRATTFEFQWKRYEPQEGVYDSSYISHMQGVLTQLNNQGWNIQLIPGFHYTPDWVFNNYPGMQYINQYGQAFNPDPITAGDFRVINAIFNPQARSLIQTYLARIFQDFDQSNPAYQFDSVRIGGGVQGELRYPPANWDGKTNSFWAFDAAAQDTNRSGIPASVIGWRPGLDPNPGSQEVGQWIVNAGFELSHPYYDTFGWSPDEEVTAWIRDGEGHSGSRGLRLTINEPNRIHQFVRVAPGTLYEAGAWLKARIPGSQARLFLIQYDENQQIIAGAPFLKLESDTNTWNLVSGSLTTSANTGYLKVELDGDRSGDYWFDDVWLSKSGDTLTQPRSIDIPTAFYDWYVQKLIDYQNWQIAEIRKHFSGSLDLVVAGKGVNQNQITDALTNDLTGNGWSELGSGLYAGTDYQRIFSGTQATGEISIYLTGVEVPDRADVDDLSPHQNEWSAARWLAQLARRHGWTIWGENTGGNNRSQMELSLERMLGNGFTGLMWSFESELYSGTGGFATAQDYEEMIFRYTNLAKTYLPVTMANH